MPYRPSTLRPIAPILKGLELSATIRLKEYLSLFAHGSHQHFVKRINDQDFAAFIEVPLNPDYKEWKEENDLDTRTMIRTDNYRDHIRLMKTETPAGVEYVIGFKKTDMAVDKDGKKTDYPLWKLALVQEYGTHNKHIPPRPHWTPQLRDMQKNFPKVVKSLIIAIEKDIAKLKGVSRG